MFTKNLCEKGRCRPHKRVSRPNFYFWKCLQCQTKQRVTYGQEQNCINCDALISAKRTLAEVVS